MNSGFELQHIVLESFGIQLVPMDLSHTDALFALAMQPNTQTYFTQVHIETVEDTRQYILKMLRERYSADRYPFMILNSYSEIIGATAFLDIRTNHKGCEIGATWIDINYRRSRVSTASKYLLMELAFETWEAERVQFRVFSKNEVSIKSITSIGAVFEGYMRNAFRLKKGERDDMALFSIVKSEWPMIKEKLLIKLRAI
jgi:RimJ/RimL family protein N-acetyltransferase